MGPCDRITYEILFLITVGVQKESPTPNHSLPAWFGVGGYGTVGNARRVQRTFRMAELACLLVVLWMKIKLLELLAVALARLQ